ncbi:hypothetical protein SFUMM280S_04874 [Streptomyces fumanus]
MPSDDTGPGLRCLVTGATGYIGGRLVPELLAAGHRVRCLARSPGRLRDHPWAGDAEVVRGDVTDPDSTAAAMRGVDVAYYLVHALGTGAGFEETDRRAARLFGERARAAGVRRVVYLGGLTPVARGEEFRDQPAPDVPRGAGDQAAQSRSGVVARHGARPSSSVPPSMGAPRRAGLHRTAVRGTYRIRTGACGLHARSAVRRSTWRCHPHEREGVGAISGGVAARFVAGEEYAAERRAADESATVVMDIKLGRVPGRGAEVRRGVSPVAP